MPRRDRVTVAVTVTFTVSSPGDPDVGLAHEGGHAARDARFRLRAGVARAGGDDEHRQGAKRHEN